MLLLSPIMSETCFADSLDEDFHFQLQSKISHKFLRTVLNGKSLDFWELCIPSHSLVVMTQLSPTLSFSILMMNMNCLQVLGSQHLLHLLFLKHILHKTVLSFPLEGTTDQKWIYDHHKTPKEQKTRHILLHIFGFSSTQIPIKQ